MEGRPAKLSLTIESLDNDNVNGPLSPQLIPRNNLESIDQDGEFGENREICKIQQHAETINRATSVTPGVGPETSLN